MYSFLNEVDKQLMGGSEDGQFQQGQGVLNRYRQLQLLPL